MLSFTGSLKIYVALEPCDMRKGFNGLQALVSERLEKGTFSWPRSTRSEALKMRLAPEAFAMLTDGIDLRDGGRRAWYERD